MAERLKKLFYIEIDPALRKDFELYNLKANIHRGKLIAIITLAIEVLVVTTSLIFKGYEKGTEADMYYMMYIMFFVVVSGFLIIMINLGKEPKVSKISCIVTLSFVAFMLAWNMGISVLDGNVTSYIISLLAINTIAIVPPTYMTMIHLGIHAAFIVISGITIGDQPYFYGVVINSTIAAVIALVASSVLYKTRAESFVSHTEVEEKNAQLETLNNKLNEANKKLEYLSNTDGLTGIYNRRMFDEMSNGFWLECEKEGENLSVIMIDIDHFKLYNDTYGHQAGDECLKIIVRKIRNIIPKHSMLARYGGEEFALLIKGCDEECVYQLSEKIRKTVWELKIEHKESPASPYVTLSIGVFCGKPERGDSVASYIGFADEALYKAKHTGRNITVKA